MDAYRRVVQCPHVLCLHRYLESIMFVTPDFPMRITIEPTNQCNYQCAMCPSQIRPEEPRGIMETALVQAPGG